jgi:maleylacetoacetate isomerase
MIRFHGYFRSSAAYRCRIAFNLKGIETENHYVHLRKGEQSAASYRNLNPQGLVPAIEVGKDVITQSLAIIEWLDETHPEPPFLPGDPIGRARARAFAQIIACDIHPLQNLRVLKFLKEELGQDQASLDAWCRRWIAEGLDACERLAAQASRNSTFVFGDIPGLAEICLVPQMFSATRFGLDLGRFPRLEAIHAHCLSIPAFARAAPSAQPDAE